MCCALQYRWLSRDFVELRKLKTLYIVKGVIASILIVLAVAFAITLFEATDPGGAQLSLYVFDHILTVRSGHSHTGVDYLVRVHVLPPHVLLRPAHVEGRVQGRARARPASRDAAERAEHRGHARGKPGRRGHAERTPRPSPWLWHWQRCSDERLRAWDG